MLANAKKGDVWANVLLHTQEKFSGLAARVLLRAAGKAFGGVRLPMPLLKAALVEACGLGDVQLVRLLLDLCPPPEEMDWMGAAEASGDASASETTTPLIAACGYSGTGIKIVQLMIQQGHVTSMLNVQGFRGR